jgi:gamma-glutamylcyclotransferase
MSLPIIPASLGNAPTEAFVYFAYGSTLDADALRAWCGEHGYRVPDLTGARRAVLRGWRLTFNVRSRFWGGAVANLTPDPDAEVEGIVLPLPGAAREFVRHKEGVSSGLYREIEIEARSGNETIKAVAYVAADDRVTPSEETPAPKFLEAMIRGASAYGLSASWLEALRHRL